MPSKPDYYTLAEIAQHLADHLPRERIELDICHGVLPVGAAVPFTAALDHATRQKGGTLSHRTRLICLDSTAARAVLREGRCSLSAARYPLFIDSNGWTERYALEHAAFTRPVTVEAADLVLFSFVLWPYVVRAGRQHHEPEREPLEPIPAEARELVIGEHYDIKAILQREQLCRQINEFMGRMRERSRKNPPLRIWPLDAEPEPHTPQAEHVSQAIQPAEPPHWELSDTIPKGYSVQLRKTLAELHRQGLAKPTAAAVLRAWREKAPPGITRVSKRAFYWEGDGIEPEGYKDARTLARAIKRHTRRLE